MSAAGRSNNSNTTGSFRSAQGGGGPPGGGGGGGGATSEYGTLNSNFNMVNFPNNKFSPIIFLPAAKPSGHRMVRVVVVVVVVVVGGGGTTMRS